MAAKFPAMVAARSRGSFFLGSIGFQDLLRGVRVESSVVSSRSGRLPTSRRREAARQRATKHRHHKLFLFLDKPPPSRPAAQSPSPRDLLLVIDAGDDDFSDQKLIFSSPPAVARQPEDMHPLRPLLLQLQRPPLHRFLGTLKAAEGGRRDVLMMVTTVCGMHW